MSIWNELIQAARVAQIPAPALRPVTLAQWILESGRGTSELARLHYNFAGLKWREEMTGYATKIRYVAHDGPDDYCAFTSPDAFIQGYWRFIGRSIYAGWQSYATDPSGYLRFLKSRGYAGDRDYVAKVERLVAEAESLLSQGPSAEDAEPDRPGRSDLGESLDDHLGSLDEPDFVTLPSVQHRWRGTRPNGLEGAIVHYDAGRRVPSRGADDPEWGGKNTLRSGQEQGFAYVTISRSGKIYLPSNMDWLSWGYHAGQSKCPKTGRTSVSAYYVGFEVNCPGYVYPTEDENVFVPWFEAVRDEHGKVILDTKGQAKVRNPNGELYSRAQLRHVASLTDNIRPGAYVPYTDAQYQALITCLLWLKRRHQQTFRLDYVFGHDEVSPGRKVDPGGSLGPQAAGDVGPPMTMKAFRAELLARWAELQALS